MKSKKINYFKLTLPHTRSKYRATQWASGTPEQFKVHMHSAIHACTQMELDVNFSRAKEAIATTILNLEIAKEEYMLICSFEKKSKRE